MSDCLSMIKRDRQDHGADFGSTIENGRDIFVKMSLYDRIEDVLLDRGLSRRRASAQCGWAESFLGNVMQNLKTKGDDAVTPRTLRTFADTFGVNYKWLSTGEGPKESAKPAAQQATAAEPPAAPRRELPQAVGHRWCDLAEWPQLREEVMRADPTIRRGTIDAFEQEAPMLIDRVSVALVLDLLRVIERHSPKFGK